MCDKQFPQTYYKSLSEIDNPRQTFVRFHLESSSFKKLSDFASFFTIRCGWETAPTEPGVET